MAMPPFNTQDAAIINDLCREHRDQLPAFLLQASTLGQAGGQLSPALLDLVGTTDETVMSAFAFAVAAAPHIMADDHLKLVRGHPGDDVQHTEISRADRDLAPLRGLHPLLRMIQNQPTERAKYITQAAVLHLEKPCLFLSPRVLHRFKEMDREGCLNTVKNSLACLVEHYTSNGESSRLAFTSLDPVRMIATDWTFDFWIEPEKVFDTCAPSICC